MMGTPASRAIMKDGGPMTKESMKCPVCGASMNNHAEKVSYDTGEGRYKPDPEFGGILEEDDSDDY